MFGKLMQEMAEHDRYDLIVLWYPHVYFPLWAVLICITVVLNMFVVYKFDGKTNESTRAVAVVQEMTSFSNYTVQVDGTNDKLQYKAMKSYQAGDSIKGYYDGKHFLSEKQAMRRGILPVLIIMVPLCIVLYVLMTLFILAIVKASLIG